MKTDKKNTKSEQCFFCLRTVSTKIQHSKHIKPSWLATRTVEMKDNHIVYHPLEPGECQSLHHKST